MKGEEKKERKGKERKGNERKRKCPAQGLQDTLDKKKTLGHSLITSEKRIRELVSDFT